jgi:CO/xanthine dehydrogenase Mo-binding subunit
VNPGTADGAPALPLGGVSVSPAPLVSHPSDLPNETRWGRLRPVAGTGGREERVGQAAAESQGTRHGGVRVVRSYFAEVAEVTVKGSEFKIGRIVAAVDCGQIVNPESVCSQTEGAIIFWVERRAEQ